MRMHTSQSSANLYNFDWFGIFAFAAEHIDCKRSSIYLAGSFDSYWMHKDGKVQMLLIIA